MMYAAKCLLLSATLVALLQRCRSGPIIGHSVPQLGKHLSGVRKLFVNIGETATMNWSEFGKNLFNNKCDKIKGICILALKPPNNEHFENIYVQSLRGSGSRDFIHDEGSKFKDRFKDRGDIVYNSSLIFTLGKANYDDKNLYCPKVMCSGVNDVVDCLQDAINLIVVDPVKHINHTATGSTTINLGDKAYGKCVANGNPPPDMKIINMNSGKVIKQGRGGELSYSFQAKHRESKLTFRCEAQNNPNMGAVSQLLKFDVKYGSPTPHVTVAIENGAVPQKGVRDAFVNIGETVTMNWSGFQENLVNKKCKVVKEIAILSLKPPKNKKFRPIYRQSRPRSGRDSSYISNTPFGDHFKGRGDIVYNSSMSFTLSEVRPDDQNLYCPRAKCRGLNNSIMDCLHDAINLIVITEPVKQMNHTATGSTNINLDDKVHAKCVADGKPPPDMKIINMNSGEVIKQGRGGELSYSFEVNQRQGKLTFLCLAENNPNMGAVTQLLTFDVKSTTNGAVQKNGWGLVTINITRPGNYTFTADNGVSSPPGHNAVVVVNQDKKGGSSQSGGKSGDETLVTVTVTVKIRP